MRLMNAVNRAINYCYNLYDMDSDDLCLYFYSLKKIRIFLIFLLCRDKFEMNILSTNTFLSII